MSASACSFLLWPCPYFPLCHVCFCHLWRKSKPFMFLWPGECFEGVHASQAGVGLLKNTVKYSCWQQFYRLDYHTIHRFTMKFMSKMRRTQCPHSKVTLLCGKQCIQSFSETVKKSTSLLDQKNKIKHKSFFASAFVSIVRSWSHTTDSDSEEHSQPKRDIHMHEKHHIVQQYHK